MKPLLYRVETMTPEGLPVRDRYSPEIEEVFAIQEASAMSGLKSRSFTPDEKPLVEVEISWTDSPDDADITLYRYDNGIVHEIKPSWSQLHELEIPVISPEKALAASLGRDAGPSRGRFRKGRV